MLLIFPNVQSCDCTDTATLHYMSAGHVSAVFEESVKLNYFFVMISQHSIHHFVFWAELFFRSEFRSPGGRQGSGRLDKMDPSGEGAISGIQF